MSKVLVFGFLCAVFTLSTTTASHQHIGLDVSKHGSITLATSPGKSVGNMLNHETFPSCVVVDCNDGSLHVPRDEHVCMDTSVQTNQNCGILRGALMIAGLNEEDDPLNNENDDQSQNAKLSLDSAGELFYLIEAFPSKKIYVDQVVDTIFSALPRKFFGSTATVMIPHDSLFEQRQAIMDSLRRSMKIEVTRSLRFNPCRVSSSDEESCSASGNLPFDDVSLDWAVFQHLEKRDGHVLSHDEIDAEEPMTEPDYSCPPDNRSSSCVLERLMRIPSLYAEASLSTTETLQQQSEIRVATLEIPSTSSPSSAPSVPAPTTSSPGRVRITHLTDVPSSGPSDQPHSSWMIRFSNNLVTLDSVLFRSASDVSQPSDKPVNRPTSVPILIPSSNPIPTPSALPASIADESRTLRPLRISRTVHRAKSESLSTTDRVRHRSSFGGYGNGEAGVLTASEWEDTKNYSFWKTLVNCTGGPPQCYSHVETRWNLCTGYPIGVSVTQVDEDNPVADLSVAIFSETHMNMKGFGRTNVHGKTTVFLKIDDPDCEHGLLEDARVSVQVERMFMGEFEVKNLKRRDGIAQVHFVIDREIKQGNGLDLMFVTDTTGSMSDELSFLKSDLEKMIENVKQTCIHSESDMKIRTSVNFYRDHGDEYVVKSFPFDEDVKRNVKRVSAQFASGGGDIPEAVDEALKDALFDHEWRKKHGVKSRLLFLILDAPPHFRSEVIESLGKSLKRAQKMGVRIVPVTGSGIDKETEMLMRAVGLLTGGSYVHLTDDSGVGLPHVETKTTIPDHPVGKLLDVMVGAIRRHLGCVEDEAMLGAKVK